MGQHNCPIKKGEVVMFISIESTNEYSPQLGNFSRGSSAGSGSGVVTSKPAEKIVPFVNAMTRSLCTTRPAS